MDPPQSRPSATKRRANDGDERAAVPSGKRARVVQFGGTTAVSPPAVAAADDDDDEPVLDEELAETWGSKTRKPRHRVRGGGGVESSESEAGEDGDVDMFGGSDDDGSNQRKKQKGQIIPLGRADLEAQEEGASEDEDETNGGIKIIPFNMRSDMEEGGFDESGTFITKKDENERYDSWMQGISKAEMKKAALAHRVREQEREEHERRATQSTRLPQDIDLTSAADLTKCLVGLLKPGETPTRAMARLNKSIQRRPPRGTPKDEEPPASKLARADVDLITELADRLVELGRAEVYGLDREDMISDLRDDGQVPRDWQPRHPTRPPTTWTFTWTHTPEEVHGPYSTDEMHAWAEQGFFAAGISAQKLVGGIPAGSAQNTSDGLELFVEP